MRIAIVGSGPAGVSCAKALIRRGAKVTILDVGETLDSGRQKIVDDLAKTAHAEWNAEKIRVITENTTIATRAIPKKLVFGSDYVYGEERSYAATERDGVDTAPTFALGGYSVAWGASMLPAADCDMMDWPITRADLESSYERVLSGIPVSAATDSLSRDFPIYCAASERLEIPRQAKELLGDLNRAYAPTATAQLSYGQARLAVRAKDSARGNGCIYCGLCLSGCVLGAIHNFEHNVRILQKLGQLEYRSGLLVEQLEEIGERVRVTCQRVVSGEIVVEEFDRVFVAAGAINTTRIMLQSLKLFDQPVRLKDSQKFVIPFLRWHRTPLEWPNINSLAALFMELKVPQLSDHWVHMQISVVNDFVLDRLGIGLGQGRSLRKRLLGVGVERLMVAWCGLHSDHSSAIELRLSKGQSQGRHVLKLSNAQNPATKATIARVSWAMARIGINFRSLFLAPLRQISSIGGGSHLGGSFPMRASPHQVLESDMLGRPAGWSRVHLVDGSVFPSIPGTTIALVIMANADRIGTVSPLD